MGCLFSSGPPCWNSGGRSSCWKASPPTQVVYSRPSGTQPELSPCLSSPPAPFHSAPSQSPAPQAGSLFSGLCNIQRYLRCPRLRTSCPRAPPCWLSGYPKDCPFPPQSSVLWLPKARCPSGGSGGDECSPTTGFCLAQRPELWVDARLPPLNPQLFHFIIMIIITTIIISLDYHYSEIHPKAKLR